MVAKTDNVMSMQRAVSVAFIQQSDGYAVKARPGQKEPAKGWDPKANSKTKSDLLLRSLEYSEDNIGLHLHGPIVDVDIDSDNPALLLALDRFLPACAHVWGRASRLRTHRVYVLREGTFEPEDMPILRRLKRIPEAKVEVRGGHQSRGEYSLLPGSVHPSGEMYEWADLGSAKLTPSTAAITDIISAIRKAGAVAVMSTYWIEGLRNDLILAFAGFLHRIFSIAATMEGLGGFSMDYEQARRLVEVLLEVTSDDSDDRKARLATFDRTWQKGEKGVPVTGATRIAEITQDSAIVNKLYSLLTDNPEIEKLEKFVARFAIWQGPGAVIDMEGIERGNPRPLIPTKQQFLNSFGDQTVEFNDKRVQLVNLLYVYSGTRRVAGLTFDPGAGRLVDDREGRKVNNWAGFEIPPWPEPVSDQEVRPFIDYVHEIIANGQDEHYEWVMSWIAHIFKDPNHRSKTALVLVGKPGAGKSFLGHRLIVPIIGHRHAAATNNVETITHTFNVLFSGMLFVQCDEAINSRQKGVAARMKALITDPSVRIEPKGIDAFMMPNHMRMLFTSNDTEDAIYLSDGMSDRRYTVLEVSPKRTGREQMPYWEKMVAWTESRDNLSKIHRWLVDRVINRALISSPLNTMAKVRMQQHSWDGFDRWLAGWVARGHPLPEYFHRHWYDAFHAETDKSTIDRMNWPRWVTFASLADSYRHFQAQIPAWQRDHADEWRVGQKLKECGAVSGKSIRMRVDKWDDQKQAKVTIRPRAYEVNGREKIAEFLDAKYGTDWVKVLEVEDDKLEELDAAPQEETEF